MQNIYARQVTDIPNHVLCFRNSTRTFARVVRVCVRHHWVGASRPDDDSVAEEDKEDATRLFRVPRRAFFAMRKGPTNRSANRYTVRGRSCAISISIDSQNSR